MNRDDAAQVLTLLSGLKPSEVDLFRELLEYMATSKERSASEVSHVPSLLDPDYRDLRRRRAEIFTRLSVEWQRVRDQPESLFKCRLLRETAYFRVFLSAMRDPLSEDHRDLSLDRSLRYAKRALGMAQRLGDLLEQARIWLVIAWHQQVQSEFASAMRSCDTALDISHSTGNVRLRVDALRRKDAVLSVSESSRETRMQMAAEILGVPPVRWSVNRLRRGTNWVDW